MWIVRLALRGWPYTVLVSVLLVVLLFGALSVTRQSLRRDIPARTSTSLRASSSSGATPALSAEEMEKRVTFITERAFSTSVSGIARIESQSISSIGIVKVYFDEGADIGGAIAQINSVTNTLTRILPPGMTPPIVVQFNASNVQVAQLTVKSETASEQQLFDYGLNFLRLRLFTVQGLATPAPFGGKQRQVMVDIDPTRLRAHGLSPDDVVTALLGANVILPAGDVPRIDGHVDY